MARRQHSIPLGGFVEHLVPEWAPEPEDDGQPDEREITLKAYAAIPTRVLDDLELTVGGRIFDPNLPGDQGVYHGFYRSGARDLFTYILKMIQAAKTEANDADRDRA